MSISIRNVFAYALAGTMFAVGVFAFAAPIADAAVYVSPGKPMGFVSDFAHVVSTDESASLDARLAAFRASSGAEIAVVTVPSLGGDTIEDYAARLFKEWGIGAKGNDTGILVVVSIGDHAARIEVGYGLEGTVTDVQAGRIVRDRMIPRFKTNDYGSGISDAIDALMSTVSADSSIGTSTPPVSASDASFWNSGIPQFIFIFGLVMLNALINILSSTKSWWFGGVLGAIAGVVIGVVWGFVFVGTVAIVLLTIGGLVLDYLVSRGGPRNGGFGGPWFSGFGSGRFGGDGGGFGGFGGGSSGGGGASGKW